MMNSKINKRFKNSQRELDLSIKGLLKVMQKINYIQ